MFKETNVEKLLLLWLMDQIKIQKEKECSKAPEMALKEWKWAEQGGGEEDEEYG